MTSQKGLGRKTEEIGKGNQLTAMRFPPGVGVIRHPQPPFGAQRHEKMKFQTTFNLHAYDKWLQPEFIGPFYIMLFSALEQTQCAHATCDFERVTVAFFFYIH